MPWGDDMGMGEGSCCEVDDLIHLKVGKSKIRLLNLKRGGSDWVPHYEKSGQTVFFEKLIWRKRPKRVFT
jgi:hypothetical protein